MAKRIIEWNEDFDYGTGPDGTNYALNSETVRGEPKWWWAKYAEADTFGPGGVSRAWKSIPVGDQGHTKMGQVARCEKYARQRLKDSSQ